MTMHRIGTVIRGAALGTAASLLGIGMIVLGVAAITSILSLALMTDLIGHMPVMQ